MREQKDRYEIFLKVCETGSFSKAAEALNYTQSGISQMMAGLEEELGVQLFARINRGVTLTDNGTRLLPYIRELANQKTRLRQAAFNINHKVEGKLRVGSISSITTLWMPEVVHYFKENYPKVKIEILDGNYDEIREWIIRGQVDCGFLSSIVADDLKFYPLRDDPLCAVFPEGHPLAAHSSVTLPQLFQYPLIIETPGCDNDIQHLMLKCPVKPNISYSFRDDTLIMAFVRSGLGVTISQELVMQAFGCPVWCPARWSLPAAGHWGWRFQDGKLGGEPDAAGISELHPAAKGNTGDKIRTKRGERYKSRSPLSQQQLLDLLGDDRLKIAHDGGEQFPAPSKDFLCCHSACISSTSGR